MTAIEKIQQMIDTGKQSIRIDYELMLEAFPPEKSNVSFNLYAMRDFFKARGYQLKPENAESNFHAKWFTLEKTPA